MKHILAPLCAAALFVASGAASAATYTFNFYGLGGDLGSSAAFSDSTGTYSLDAYAVNTESPGATLNQSLLGLGVDSGHWDSQQIDNRGDDEAIVFDLSQLFIPQSARLSLVSDGGWLSGPDAFQVWGSNDSSVLGCNDSGGLSCLTTGSTALQTGSGGGSGIFDILDVNLSGNGSFQYLIATVPGGSGDDYRIKQLTVAPIPLPAAGWMLLAGMGGLVALRRKKRRIPCS